MRTKKQIKEKLKYYEFILTGFSNKEPKSSSEEKYYYSMKQFAKHKIEILEWTLQDKDNEQPKGKEYNSIMNGLMNELDKWSMELKEEKTNRRE